MTERSMNIDPSELNDAARLRALADGEIPRDQAGDVDESGLAFEEALRASVGRVMDSDVRAPEALRASIEEMFAQERASERAPEVVSTPMGDTTDRSFWAGPVARLLPVAAVLALVVTLVGFGAVNFFGTQGPPAPFEITRASNVTEFVPRVHSKYGAGCDPATFAAKFGQRSIDDAAAYAGEYLGGLPAPIREKIGFLEDAGFEFAGIGQCAVPGEGKSVHAYFRQEGADEAVSVFIQQAASDALGKVCEQHCFGASCDDSSEPNLFVWKCSGMLHYIYSPDASVTEAARAAIQAPTKTASLLR